MISVNEYEARLIESFNIQIPFARADGDKLKALIDDNDISSLPALVFFNSRKAVVYQGYHALEPVVAFINKQIGKPVVNLKTVADVNDFIELRGSRKHSLSTVHVVRNTACLNSLTRYVLHSLCHGIRLDSSRSMKTSRRTTMKTL